MGVVGTEYSSLNEVSSGGGMAVSPKAVPSAVVHAREVIRTCVTAVPHPSLGRPAYTLVLPPLRLRSHSHASPHTHPSLARDSDCVYDAGHGDLVPIVIDAYLAKDDPSAVCYVVLPTAKYRHGIPEFEAALGKSAFFVRSVRCRCTTAGGGLPVVARFARIWD